MNEMLTGAIAMGFVVAALFFYRFWRKTDDRLFIFFAVSFLLLAISRIALGLAPGHGYEGEYFYWIRLLAYGLILAAILDKNWNVRSRLT
jgi:hypothetical protein